MLGHLVNSRYMIADEHETHEPRRHTNWLVRLMSALRSRRDRQPGR